MSDVIADVFAPDLFTTTSLTAAINLQPYLPGRIGQMGLFSEQGVSTTSVVVELQDGTLTVIPAGARGGPGATGKDDKRRGVTITAPHLKQSDALYADSVQGVRVFGSPNQLQSVTQKRDEKLAKMGRNLEFTLEYHRLGAIQGKVLDADGVTVLLNAFTAFGVAEPGEVDFDLDNADPASGVVRKACAGIVRSMSAALGAQPFTGVHALCGDTFWDQLIAHREVRETYQAQNAAQMREGTAYQTLSYGGIDFENYRGYGAVEIAATKCRFVAKGVPDLFQTYYAPADYMETVNTIGLPKYSKSEPMKMGRGMELEAQSNPINVCTRPGTLLRAKNT